MITAKDGALFETTATSTRFLMSIDANENFMGRVAARFLCETVFDPAIGAQRLYLRSLD